MVYFFTTTVPKHTRAVNSVAWSALERQLLAAGLDKGQRDHSLVIFDVTRPTQTPPYGYDQRVTFARFVLLFYFKA